MAEESSEVIRARIEELEVAAKDACPDCSNGIPSKWYNGQRIHMGWNGQKLDWLTFHRCKAEAQHRRIEVLQDKLEPATASV